ncbi:hypothetical protein RRSWK_03851 [Rhodopirellula sp. SWK7]|nr:hypothetical protein RRSWK_03851 [Rhodopirellula sp. SWK7]
MKPEQGGLVFAAAIDSRNLFYSIRQASLRCGCRLPTGTSERLRASRPQTSRTAYDVKSAKIESTGTQT